MEKLRSQSAYSIVAVLRSTALRRVTSHVHDLHRASKHAAPSLFAKLPENQRLNSSRFHTSQMGDLTSCSTAFDGDALTSRLLLDDRTSHIMFGPSLLVGPPSPGWMGRYRTRK
jgi:hypothetical protein